MPAAILAALEVRWGLVVESEETKQVQPGFLPWKGDRKTADKPNEGIVRGSNGWKAEESARDDYANRVKR